MHRVVTLAIVLALGSGTAYAKSCKDAATGQIVQCPAPMLKGARDGGQPSTRSNDSRPHCLKGKICGNACIARAKICHK